MCFTCASDDIHAAVSSEKKGCLLENQDSTHLKSSEGKSCGQKRASRKFICYWCDVFTIKCTSKSGDRSLPLLVLGYAEAVVQCETAHVSNRMQLNYLEPGTHASFSCSTEMGNYRVSLLKRIYLQGLA